jgi:hypothetical protein
MRTSGANGFSLIELVVSAAIMLAVTGSVFGLSQSARHVFELDLERSEMHQRARVSVDALFSDLIMAGAGTQVPAIAPFRRGDNSPDAPGSAFADRISVRYFPGGSAGMTVITFALGSDAAGVPHLRRYDGRTTDLPVVDQIAGLSFEYFDIAGEPMALGRFTDGPWIPDAVAADRYDADLDGIHRVRARVRVRPARTFIGLPLADLEVAIDVAPRNVNLQ